MSTYLSRFRDLSSNGFAPTGCQTGSITVYGCQRTRVTAYGCHEIYLTRMVNNYSFYTTVVVIRTLSPSGCHVHISKAYGWHELHCHPTFCCHHYKTVCSCQNRGF